MAPQKSTDVAAARAAAQKFDTTFDEIKAVLTRLDGQIAAVQWVGQSRSTFDQVYHDWHTAYDKLHTDMNTISQSLHNTANNQQNTSETALHTAKFF